MRKRIFLISLLFLAWAVQLSGQDWKEVTSSQWGFRASFPGEPQSKPNDSNTGTRFFTSQENQNVAYFVEAADLPADLNKTATQIFDDYAAGSARGVKGRIVSQQDVKLGALPGRDIEIETDEMILSTRLYLMNRRLYQLVFVATRSLAPAHEQDHTKFFQSFAVIAQP